MKSCENCGNFDRTNNKGTEACGDCESIEPTKWKPTMTNGDRIRAMSDEELYDLFREIYNAGFDDSTAFEWWGEIKNGFMWNEEWLKQPAEG